MPKPHFGNRISRAKPPQLQPQPPHKIDVSEIRSAIRDTLAFEHKPLEGGGRVHTIGMQECGKAPFREIVAELLVSLWETGAKLTEQSAVRKLYSFRRLVDFIKDSESPFAKSHAPRVLKDITFEMLRDFERWAQDRRPPRKSHLPENIARLQARVQEPLPLSKKKRWFVRLSGERIT